MYVRHATELFMQDPDEVLEVMRAGAERRSVASTSLFFLGVSLCFFFFFFFK